MDTSSHSSSTSSSSSSSSLCIRRISFLRFNSKPYHVAFQQQRNEMVISGLRLPELLLGLTVMTLAVVIFGGQFVLAHQGCKSRGLCCQGKNNTCRSTRLDNIRGPSKKLKPLEEEEKEVGASEAGDGMREEKARSCFCDSSCLDLGDCCEDYSSFCKPVDCVVAAKWGDWGACDARCGPGVKQRTRKIIRAPINGGKSCNTTVEKIACEGSNCKVARAPEGLEQLAETGKIIPASFGPWRKSKLYDPFRDIRKNLFDYYKVKDVVNRPSYCIKFELTEVPAACNSTDGWTNGLVKGADLCVECQTMAMHKQLGGRCLGQGVLLRETRWNALLRPGCHGKWVMQSRQEECQCDDKSVSSFILL